MDLRNFCRAVIESVQINSRVFTRLSHFQSQCLETRMLKTKKNTHILIVWAEYSISGIWGSPRWVKCRIECDDEGSQCHINKYCLGSMFQRLLSFEHRCAATRTHNECSRIPYRNNHKCVHIHTVHIYTYIYIYTHVLYLYTHVEMHDEQCKDNFPVRKHFHLKTMQYGFQLYRKFL